MHRFRPYLWLLPLALYLSLALHQLHLPGPNYDEAIEAQPAVQILQNLPVEAHRDAVVRVFGKSLPLMIVDYVGALNTYMLILYFKLGGIGVITMRLWPITVGALILWLTYRLGRQLMGLRAGLVAAALLAVQPSFIFFMRQGIYVTNTTIALMLAIWLALIRLAETGRPRWAWLIAFMAGLGLWAKFIMLWPLLATAILAPIIWIFRDALGLSPASDFGPRVLLRPRVWLPALLAFLLGLSPFLLFNLKTGATFKHFMATLTRSYYGVENTAYLTNLSERWSQMRHFLRGDHFWYLGGNFADAWAYPAFIMAFLILLGVLAWRWRDDEARRLALRGLAVYAFFALLLLQTPLTPTALWYTHLSMFSPVLALAIALGWDMLFGRFSPPWSGLFAGLFVLMMAVSGLRADMGYHRALAASGGLADHSDALYRLSDELLARNVTAPYALDWGFEAPVILISQGRVNPIGVFNYEPFDRPDDAFPERMRPLLQQPGAVFLVHAPNRTNFPGRREALQALAADMGLELNTIAVIRERSGEPHSELWMVR
ncbi:MAG: hypothetical protein GXP42_00805 [Chloroflexi bacterium]|nr:hypothetical protein [Chloroflexota bacterium]